MATRRDLKDWDLDFAHGTVGEQLVEAILSKGATVEVKRDRYSHRTGHVAVEFRWRGKPSGIAATKAAWWAWVLDGADGRSRAVLFVQTDHLRAVARVFHRKGKVVAGGDDGDSDMVLVPLVALFPGRTEYAEGRENRAKEAGTRTREAAPRR